MSALKKPVSPGPDQPSDPKQTASDDVFARPAPVQALSPVHVLQARIEAAFSRANERRTLRVSTMLLVMSLSLWLAALMLQAG